MKSKSFNKIYQILFLLNFFRIFANGKCIEMERANLYLADDKKKKLNIDSYVIDI